MSTTSNHLVLSSTTIEGTNVRNLADEKLGDIKDLMLDVDTGRIAYAVLSVNEGFLGIGTKYFAIPWKALRFDTNREIALLDVSKEKLENSPGFDKDNWPSGPQHEFVNEVHSYYGYDSFYNQSNKEASYDRNVNDQKYNSNIGDTSVEKDANNPNRNRL